MKDSGKRVILMVSNDLTCDNRVHKMAVTLCKSGYSVLVVGRELPNSISLSDVCYEQKRLKLFCKKGPWFYAEMNLRYFLFLMFHSFDIATANDLDTLLGVYCATRIKKKEIVYDCHEYYTEVPELANRERVRNIWDSIERMIFPKLKYCMTVCDSISESYRREYGVEVAVVRNLPQKTNYDFEPISLNLPCEKVILYQGALNVGRGLELLIKSMAFIDDACLLIVGSGDVADDLQVLALMENVADKIVFAGRVKCDELKYYTKLATIGVSLEEDLGLNYRFALPNKIFDYIQAGKPILISDLPEMSKIVLQYQCGELVTSRTPENLAKQINELLHDNQKLEQYSLQSTIAARKLCWENEENIVQNIYRKISLKNDC